MQSCQDRMADIVLDPMFGSGSCLVAAHQLNRRFIGIEKSEEGFATAAAWLEKEGAVFEKVICDSESILDAFDIDFNDGKNRIFRGDAYDILTRFPDSIANLIYFDPPFGSNADKRYFGISWKWTSESETYLARISDEYQRDYISLIKRANPNIAAYLAWITPVLQELHRICGVTLCEECASENG